MNTLTRRLLCKTGFKSETFSNSGISKSIACGALLTALGINETAAQFSLTGQVRTRTEYREGFLTPQAIGQKPALFTSQRTRLNAGFNGYRFKTYLSLQDTRVWGQDVSSVNRNTVDPNDGLMLHQAWGEIILNDTVSKIKNVSLKIGRQEIAYDDQKVMGSLDWLQQARRHDAIVLKIENKSWVADIGAAFNQNGEKPAGMYYEGGVPTGTTPGPGTNGIGKMYKSFQYAYIGKKFYFGNLSFLFFKDDFSRFENISTGVKPLDGVWSRMTTGIYYNVNPTRKINLTGSFYHQGGQYRDARKLSAQLASITSTFQVGRKWFVGPGVDYLSGNNGTKKSEPFAQSNQFDPLYGTPHKFWGAMDYFYVASPFGSQGLLNYFFKAKYAAKDNLTFFAELHGFEAANKVSDGKGGERDSYYGTELDLRATYGLTKLVNIEAGFSTMSAKNTIAALKNVTTPNLNPHFAYLSVNITPDFLAKK